MQSFDIRRLHTFLLNKYLMLYSKHLDINRFKNACKEFLEASGHKVSSVKVLGDEVHLQYKENGTGDMYSTVFKPWV